MGVIAGFLASDGEAEGVSIWVSAMQLSRWDRTLGEEGFRYYPGNAEGFRVYS